MEASMKTRIVLFAKQPFPGRVKTRLIPTLGAEGAARLARRMLASTLREAVASGLAVELCGDPDARLWGPISLGLTLSGQGEGDLGARLTRAAERTTANGEAVLLIGADCPGLNASHLRDAAAALNRHDAVIHPAEDGGYALLGLRRSDPSVFDRIAWSGPDVASQTCARIGALGWSLAIHDTLRDVDQPADLALLPRPLLPVAR
jgi:rSAM/selenodomain-associated transferase 1